MGTFQNKGLQFWSKVKYAEYTSGRPIRWSNHYYLIIIKNINNIQQYNQNGCWELWLHWNSGMRSYHWIRQWETGQSKIMTDKQEKILFYLFLTFSDVKVRLAVVWGSKQQNWKLGRFQIPTLIAGFLTAPKKGTWPDSTLVTQPGNLGTGQLHWKQM